MFRLDYIDGNPASTGQETRSMRTARERAIQIAAASGIAVLISRVIPAIPEPEYGPPIPERTLPTQVIHPDGRATMPDNVQPTNARDQCSRSDDGPPCFCPACRDERRGKVQ